MYRAIAILAFAALAVALPACESGGHFKVLGYTTRPNYDTNIKTVFVPIFANKTMYRGMEFDLTKAVVRTIEQKTPYKVISDRDCADTELLGTIVAFNKNVINRNQLNEVREGETVLTCEIVWRDVRSGEVLSQPKTRSTAPPSFGPMPDNLPGGSVPPTLTPGVVEGTPGPSPAKPVIVTSIGNYVPEVGQSTTTAQQMNFNKMAINIANLMEKPW